MILRLPMHTPDGFGEALRRETEALEWIRFDAGKGGDLPVSLLFQRLAPDAARDVAWTPSNLASDERFQSHGVWLDGIDETNWGAWRAFLTDYAHAMRDVSLLERTVFVVPLRDRHALLPADEDVGIVDHAWGHDMRREDATFLAGLLLERRNLPLVHRRVAVAVLAELALWDPDLAVRLAGDGLHVLTDPYAILDEVRRERGWDDRSGVQHSYEEAWSLGVAATVDGRRLRHLASLDSPVREREVCHRIWRAQLSTVMPFIEEIRHGAIATYGRSLRPRDDRSRHDGLYDLEIGDVAVQLHDDDSVPLPHRRMLRQLHLVRNELAHLRTVGWDDVPREYPLDLVWRDAA